MAEQRATNQSMESRVSRVEATVTALSIELRDTRTMLSREINDVGASVDRVVVAIGAINTQLAGQAAASGRVDVRTVVSNAIAVALLILALYAAAIAPLRTEMELRSQLRSAELDTIRARQLEQNETLAARLEAEARFNDAERRRLYWKQRAEIAERTEWTEVR